MDSDESDVESGSDVGEILTSDSEESEDENYVVHNRGPWLPVLDPDEDRPQNVPHEYENNAGVAADIAQDASPLQYFELFLADPDGGDSIIDVLVRETNLYAQQRLDAAGDQLPPHSRLSSWIATSTEEMRPAIGVIMAMGVLRKRSFSAYFNDGQKTWLTHTPNYQKVFTRNRLQNIHRNMHVADNTTIPGPESPMYDPTDKFQPLIQHFNKVFAANYK